MDDERGLPDPRRRAVEIPRQRSGSGGYDGVPSQRGIAAPTPAPTPASIPAQVIPARLIPAQRTTR